MTTEMFIFGALGAVVALVAGIVVNIGTRILVMVVAGVLIMLTLAWLAGRSF